MADPTKYNPGYSFSGYQASNPSDPLPGNEVDGELADVSAAINSCVDAIKDVRRSDGKIQNGVVAPESLSQEARILISLQGCTYKGLWVTATAYAIGDMVTESSTTYLCVIAHTSGTFATDLAAAKWIYISSAAGGSASAINFTPTGSISSTNVQGAIAEVDTDVTNLTTSVTANGWVTTTRIQDGAVTSTKIGTGAVGSTQLADGSVGTAKIQDGAITAAKLDSGYVGQGSISTVGTIGTGTWQGSPVGVSYGGTGQTTASAAINALVPTQTGQSGKFLTTNGTSVSWASAAGSGVTSVATSGGLTGGTITSTGTISIDTNNAGGVGAYALMKNNSGSTVNNGATTAGSGLQFAYFNSTSTLSAAAGTPSGTWRNVAGVNLLNQEWGLFMRTA